MKIIAYLEHDGVLNYVQEGSSAYQAMIGDEPDAEPEFEMIPALDIEVEDDGSIQGSRSIAKAYLQGETDINVQTKQIRSDVDLSISNSSDFIFSESGTTVEFDGLLKIDMQIGLWSTGTEPQRAAPILEVTVNGQAIASQARQTYIRAQSGHNNTTAKLTDLISVKQGDLISVQSSIGAAAGVVNIEGGKSFLILERV